MHWVAQAELPFGQLQATVFGRGPGPDLTAMGIDSLQRCRHSLRLDQARGLKAVCKPQLHQCKYLYSLEKTESKDALAW